MRRQVKQVLTGRDNETYDIGRISLFIASMAFLVFTGYDLYLNKKFDAQAFGLGFGSMSAGAGALLKLKENTEPGGDAQ